MKNKQIIRNAIITPDGTMLKSEYLENRVSYLDTNGHYYSVEGGLNYIKRDCDSKDYKEISIVKNIKNEKITRWNFRK